MGLRKEWIELGGSMPMYHSVYNVVVIRNGIAKGKIKLERTLSEELAILELTTLLASTIPAAKLLITSISKAGDPLHQTN